MPSEKKGSILRITGGEKALTCFLKQADGNSPGEGGGRDPIDYADPVNRQHDILLWVGKGGGIAILWKGRGGRSDWGEAEGWGLIDGRGENVLKRR